MTFRVRGGISVRVRVSVSVGASVSVRVSGPCILDIISYIIAVAGG